jgi:hypothetical protein
MRHRSSAHRSTADANALRAVVDAVVGGAEDEAAALHGGLVAVMAALGADAGAVIRHGHLVIARARALDRADVALVHAAAALLARAVLDLAARLRLQVIA